MGSALAEAVLRQGGVPIVVSGTVAVSYPVEAEVHWVETTEQMLQCCLELFPKCIGIIGAAAPCDFRPVSFSEQKISKIRSGHPHHSGQKDFGGILLPLTETPDILAAIGQIKRPDQWSIAFALETEDGENRAQEKLKQKNCDFIVLNSPDAINRDAATFQIFDAIGKQQKKITGSKRALADELLRLAMVKPQSGHRERTTKTDDKHGQRE